jgi:Domain of unknown function (DUF4389)
LKSQQCRCAWANEEVTAMATAGVYPVHVDASLDPPLSRWLWIVKWVLAIPHYILLGLLWIAFTVLSVAAFFAILFTGRYPKAIFDFNVGVLRWTWRVQYYTIGAFGTDQYPPFTLAERPDYPAHLEIEYPQHLSRGLVLVKWWLLAIPHYIIIGLFTGSGVWFAWRFGNADYNWGSVGLIGLLAVIAAIILLFTGRYPEQIFDFVLGMNRWVLRVAGYVGLMTDKYPPFRMDLGGHEPSGILTLPSPPPPAGPASPPAAGQAMQFAPPPAPADTGQAFPAGPVTPPAPGQVSGPGPAGQFRTGGPGGWTAGRIVSVVIGAVLVLVSLGFLGGGAGALWATTARNTDGYLDLGTTTYSTTGYALASQTIGVHAAGNNWDAAKSLFGTLRIRATSTAGAPVFIGIATPDAASRYLAGVQYATVRDTGTHHPAYTMHSGTAPAVPPATAGLWTARASGFGTQTLIWQVSTGDWTVIAMNADASQPVSVRVNVAATLPALPWIAGGLLIAGVIFLAGGVALIAVPVRRASR